MYVYTPIEDEIRLERGVMDSFPFGILYWMKRKKIYYLPGMISLIGLPLFVWIFLAPHHQAQDRVYSKPLRLVLPSDEPATVWKQTFSKKTFLRDIRRKKILEVALNETRSAAYDSLLQYQKVFIF